MAADKGGAGAMDDRTLEGLKIELKQLRKRLAEAERIQTEMKPKATAIETTLRAYNVNVDALD